jgi:hypothetical protein
VDFQVLLVVFVFFFFAYLGFARIASNKKEWKEERKKNYEMAFVGSGFIVLVIFVAALFRL